MVIQAEALLQPFFVFGRNGMRKITSLKQQSKRDHRVNVFLDGEYAFSLEKEVAFRAGLHVGQELTPEETTQLTSQDQRQKCFNAACRFLSYRPRSEQEVRRRLERQGYDDTFIQPTIARLKELGLVDDAEFARLWVDNRDELRPRSRRLIQMELRQKGLSRDIIERATGSVNETEAAYRAAEKKAKSLLADDYDTFRKRLAGYLARRGFGYETLASTIERIWKENEHTT